MFFGDFQRGPPLLQAHGGAGWILEVGNQVQQLGPGVLPGNPLQRLQIQAVLLHGHALQPDIVGAEGVEGTDKAGVFTEKGVALVEQHLGGKLNPLLGPGDDDQVIIGLADGIPPGKPLLQRFPEPGVSLAHRILQGGDGFFGEDIRRYLLYFPGGERLRRGIARRQRDHPRFGGKL